MVHGEYAPLDTSPLANSSDLNLDCDSVTRTPPNITLVFQPSSRLTWACILAMSAFSFP